MAESFLFPIPAWVIVRRDKNELPFECRVDGARYVTIFSDKDLAERFVAAQKLQDQAEIRPLSSEKHFANSLAYYASMGCTGVVLDPPEQPGHARWQGTIDEWLRMLARQGIASMQLQIQGITVPLFDDGQGGLRVTGTRVQLERIIDAFGLGETPEQIVQDYGTLELGSVYAVIAWYLQHKADVDAYLAERAKKADERLQEILAKQPDQAELRARLMARLAEKEKAHAAAGQ